ERRDLHPAVPIVSATAPHAPRSAAPLQGAGRLAGGAGDLRRAVSGLLGGGADRRARQVLAWAARPSQRAARPLASGAVPAAEARFPGRPIMGRAIMKILVSGSTGFVGSALVPFLASDG